MSDDVIVEFVKSTEPPNSVDLNWLDWHISNEQLLVYKTWENNLLSCDMKD
jgi:hypothetical protein